MKYPLLINGETGISVVGIPRNKFPREGAIFLVDTGVPGITQPLVNLFLPQIIDDKAIKKVIEFANNKRQCEATERKRDRALRRAILRHPGHQQSADREDEWLNDFDRRKFAGTEFIALADHHMQLETARKRNLKLRQHPRNECDAQEVS